MDNQNENYMEGRLEKEINVILSQMDKKQSTTYVAGKKNSDLVRIDIKRILYIERARRKSIIHCVDNEEYTSPKKLEEWIEKLSEAGFLFAHNSYIVNIRHVEIAGITELQLDTGQILSISRSRSKAFRVAFENM